MRKCPSATITWQTGCWSAHLYKKTSLAWSATLEDSSWARLTFHLRVSCHAGWLALSMIIVPILAPSSSWNLWDSQLSWECKMKPSVAKDVFRFSYLFGDTAHEFFFRCSYYDGDTGHKNLLRCSTKGGDHTHKNVLSMQNRVGTPHIKICSDVQKRVGTPHIKICWEVYIRLGTPHIKMCLDVQSRVGTPHIKMCSNVQNRVGTAHIKICSDVQYRVGTSHIECDKMIKIGWGHRTYFEEKI